MAIDFSRLSENQIQFLETRRATKTDREAYEALDQARSTLARWKQNKLFKQAYNSILSSSPPVEIFEVPDIVVSDQEIKDLADKQLRALSQYLPAVFQRLFNIMKGGKDADSLRAVKMITDMLGIGPEMLAPETLDFVQRQIQKWTGQDANSNSSTPAT